MSVRSIAKQVPISDTQLRYWFRGRDARGQDVNFPSRQLARVASILNVHSEQLREVGRQDAADILDHMNRELPVAKTYSLQELGRLVEGMSQRITEIEDEIDRIVERSEDVGDG